MKSITEELKSIIIKAERYDKLCSILMYVDDELRIYRDGGGSIGSGCEYVQSWKDWTLVVKYAKGTYGTPAKTVKYKPRSGSIFSVLLDFSEGNLEKIGK